uniref:NADH-ubiquinone oxidoreductase chain 5 n=1 Tax=Lepidopsocidae sp. RS-2001 TaxID=159971 RepID=Q7YHL9_9NEOP|nr:NADH dehydrogenase subunit 5 [Lepidopsocidae sp. RS-2001]AAP44719.1 NADH dehydrogenase subunit 5 [Lepidopsocidae sp. RS-2001]
MINYLNKKKFFIFSFFLGLMSLIFFFFGIILFNFELVYFLEWDMLMLNSVNIQIVILFDWMSMFFLSLVTFISCLISNYSNSYMLGDNNSKLFMFLIIMFVFSMMLMIVSPNMISILLGWDGLGLVSYILVIYYQNVKSYNAGMLTVLSNRIGDIMILICIGWLFSFGSWNYYFYINMITTDDYLISLIGWFIIIAGMTKSAQIPFSSWLPAAMAAPTPVSALVHSSTLVTAGVYLLIRFFPLFNISKFSMILLFISGLTMFMSGLGANFEFDLKKIIALSTLSQLGLMMGSLSMGLTNFCFFHLLSHALFKALLFMCAGYLIHYMNNCQDIRYMGGLSKQLPFVSLCFNVSNLSLCGIPFLSGFYSKDLILELISMSEINLISYFFFFASTGFTISYSFRLFSFLMLGNFNLFSFHCIEDKDYIMMKSMFGLFLGSLFGGSMLMWLIFPFSKMILLPLLMKFMVLFLILIGIFLGIVIYEFMFWFKNFFKLMYMYNMKVFLGSMWFMPIISTYLISYMFLNVGYNYMKYIDYGWLEKLGGQGLKEMFIYMTKFNQDLKGFNYKIYLFIFIYIYMFVYLFWLIM